MLWLKANGYNNVTCVAAPKKHLNIKPSKTRVTPIIDPLHPKDVAKALGYRYQPTEHDSELTKLLMETVDVGVVLGARIIKEDVLKIKPIINMHPGFLPLNRGLDNLKWAIHYHIPQAVTSHIIDRNIDRGFMIDRKILDVHQDDSLLDVFLRLQNMELKLMIDALKKDLNYPQNYPQISKGHYHGVMPDHLDITLEARFKEYKANYDKIKRNHE